MTNSAYQQRTDRYIALITRHKNLLFWLCCRSARFRRQQALDYHQDVLQRLWYSLDTLPVNASLGREKAWVRLQVRSVLFAQRRDEPPPTLPLNAAAGLADDDRQHEARELLDELMAYLRDDDRQLLQQQLDGYTAAEMAVDLRVTPHAVELRLARIRKRLRQIYEKLYNNPT